MPFALPTVSYWVIGLIYRADQMMEINSYIPRFDAVSLMFVNIMGILGVIWALARIGSPNEDLARLDALGRIIVAALIIHAITWGATPILWGFVATELIGSALQFRRRASSGD